MFFCYLKLYIEKYARVIINISIKKGGLCLIIQTCAIDYCFDRQAIDALEKEALSRLLKIMIQRQIKKVIKAKGVKIILSVFSFFL